MHKEIYAFAALYFALISLITFILTLIDKIKAKKHKRRISEKCLFTLAFLGGSVSEYITMKIIRHKTLHKRFMIGLPLIFALQLTLIFLIFMHQSEFLSFFK